jgi:methionine-gamma-lyase
MDMRLGPVMVLGPTLDPKVAAELGLRLPHLGLRVREQGRRALAFAQALQAAGASVRYPGLPSHPHAARWARLANPGYGAGGVLTLDAGSRPAADRLMERLQNKVGFGLMAVSLGYHETLLSVSGASTSSEMPAETRAAVGLSDGLLRISCGYTGSLSARVGQLQAAWAAHVAGEAARASGKTPPYRAAAVVRDGRGGLTRLASWDSFGSDVEAEDGEGVGEENGVGDGGNGEGSAPTPGKVVPLGAGKEVIYMKAAAAARGGATAPAAE